MAYPDEDWNTTEFLAAAVALTKGEGETAQYGYAPSGSEIDDLISFMDRLGVRIVDDSEDPARLEINTSDAIKTMRWYSSLTTQYGVTPVADASAGPMGGPGGRVRILELVRQNRVGMWTSTNLMRFGGGPGQQASALALNVGAAPLPTGANSAKGKRLSNGGRLLYLEQRRESPGLLGVDRLFDRTQRLKQRPARQALDGRV